MTDSEIYAQFLKNNKSKSGVTYQEAMYSGVDLHTFKKVATVGEIKGTLILKIWSNSGKIKMLWNYVRTSDGEGVYFPAFRGSNDGVCSRLIEARLGDNLKLEFKKNKQDKIYCVSGKISTN